MYETISYIVKYLFVLIIYLFIFGIMRMIYLDIRSMNSRNRASEGNLPYLKLLNKRESLDFKIEEAYTLDRTLSIGRAPGNDIILGDPFLSKKHAEFAAREGRIYLADLDSRNGTYLNGNRLERGAEICLADGDKIRMGGIEFLFMDPPGEV